MLREAQPLVHRMANQRDGHGWNCGRQRGGKHQRRFAVIMKLDISRLARDYNYIEFVDGGRFGAILSTGHLTPVRSDFHHPVGRRPGLSRPIAYDPIPACRHSRERLDHLTGDSHSAP